MRYMAATSDELLEMVLFRLHKTGWTRIDVQKLVDVYVTFADRSGRCVYHLKDDPDRHLRLYDALSVDIDALIAKSHAQRTVGRVFLTPKGMTQAVWLAPSQALHSQLLPSAEQVFPPLAPTA